MIETDRALEALQAIPSDMPRDEWHKVGRAAIAAGLSIDDLVGWSATASNYKGESDVRSAFRTITKDGGTGPGTLFAIARDHGFSLSSAERGAMGRTALPEARQTSPVAPKTKPPASKPATGMRADEVWSRCKPATHAHPYIAEKHAAGVPLEHLRVVPAGDPLTVAGERMAGALVVPVQRPGDMPASLQFIPPPEVAARLKAKEKPGKLNLPGARMDGWFVVGELVPAEPVYLCEGIGQAWACWQATGRASVVAFGWGRVKTVAEALRQQYPAARLVLVPDAGKEKDAAKIAAAVRCEFVAMPEGWPQNSDVNDMAKQEGHDALADLLGAAKPPPLPLGTVFADELAAAYEPPDELVQGILTAGAGSMLYGDSNSGKTFFTIDMACAVARGVPWMGRKTEQGLVVYVAAESPASVRSRLHAYQQHHQCRVPNFAIVQSPFDLFSSNTDTEALIALVKLVERQKGQKVRLIVGDTLARLSAGANENSGEDMGLVVQRFDRIRAECDAHFLMIHHSGKAAANGARGWSGIRAAMDTEIEVTDRGASRCAEVTKQRDLSSKGERIGFTLERIEIGFTKWGEPATTCIVLPADAPEMAVKGKQRMGEVGGAVVEFLAQRKVGIRKAEVAKHFEGRYERSNVYRAIRSLVAAQAIHEAAGMVCIAAAAK